MITSGISVWKQQNNRQLKQISRKIISQFDNDVWGKGMSFYLDGTSFIWKRNPTDQALAPRGRIWHKADDGLKVGCISKGFMTGTSSNEQYERICVRADF